jgi:hypothetical protein
MQSELVSTAMKSLTVHELEVAQLLTLNGGGGSGGGVGDGGGALHASYFGAHQTTANRKTRFALASTTPELMATPQSFMARRRMTTLPPNGSPTNGSAGGGGPPNLTPSSAAVATSANAANTTTAGAVPLTDTQQRIAAVQKEIDEIQVKIKTRQSRVDDLVDEQLTAGESFPAWKEKALAALKDTLATLMAREATLMAREATLISKRDKLQQQPGKRTPTID